MCVIRVLSNNVAVPINSTPAGEGSPSPTRQGTPSHDSSEKMEAREYVEANVPVVEHENDRVNLELAGLREEMARVLRRMNAMEGRIREMESRETRPGRYFMHEARVGGWGESYLKREPEWVAFWDDRGYEEKCVQGIIQSWIPALDASYIGGDYPWWLIFAKK